MADLIELLRTVPGAMEQQLESIARQARQLLDALSEWQERNTP